AEQEDAVGALEDDPERIEEDHLYVEEDEEHRDQVEAHPEPHGVGGLDGDARLIGLGLPLGRRGRPLRPLRAEHVVEHHERRADGATEEGEDENREVALEHWKVRYTPSL